MPADSTRSANRVVVVIVDGAFPGADQPERGG